MRRLVSETASLQPTIDGDISTEVIPSYCCMYFLLLVVLIVLLVPASVLLNWALVLTVPNGAKTNDNLSLLMRKVSSNSLFSKIANNL